MDGHHFLFNVFFPRTQNKGKKKQDGGGAGHLVKETVRLFPNPTGGMEWSMGGAVGVGGGEWWLGRASMSTLKALQSTPSGTLNRVPVWLPVCVHAYVCVCVCAFVCACMRM